MIFARGGVRWNGLKLGCHLYLGGKGTVSFRRPNEKGPGAGRISPRG